MYGTLEIPSDKGYSPQQIQKWLEVIMIPSVNLVMGFRRMGKTALVYWLTDVLGDLYNRPKIVYGVPPDILDYLPQDFFLVNDLDEIPPEAILICDEMGQFAHARESKSTKNNRFIYLTDMSGKLNQIIFYLAHHSRKVDVQAIVMESNAFILKRPARIWKDLERSAEIRRIINEALKLLKGKDKSWSYIYDNLGDFGEGILKNPLPYFWTNELSNMLSLAKETVNVGYQTLHVIYLSKEVDLESLEYDVIFRNNYPATPFKLVKKEDEYECYYQNHRVDVLDFVNKLRESGIDCVVDTKVDLEKIK